MDDCVTFTEIPGGWNYMFVTLEKMNWTWKHAVYGPAVSDVEAKEDFIQYYAKKKSTPLLKYNVWI